MTSALNSSSQPGKPSRSGSLPRVTALGGLTESIAKELNESLCGVVVNASACLRKLAADPPNLEGARETAHRTIRSSMRAAEAISLLHDLLSETNKRIESVAPSRRGSSRVTPGGTL
jgi:hypothetical protein